MQTRMIGPIGPVHREMLKKSREARARLYGGKAVDSQLVETLQVKVSELLSDRDLWRARCQNAEKERDLALDVIWKAKEYLRVGNMAAAMLELGMKMDGSNTPVVEIMKAVSSVSRTLAQERHSERREKNLVHWRHIEMFLMRSKTNLSFPDIGRRMGGRDHSTVLYGVRKVEANFPRYAADIAKCEALL